MGFLSAVKQRMEEMRQTLEKMTEFPWAQEWPEITDERVRAAFAVVPRSAFVPEDVRPWANRDAPLPIGDGQTISQPYVVALMTQAISPRPGDRVLEIGTGSGFQTAILCELTAAPGAIKGLGVYSVERVARLQEQAVSTLHKLNYAPELRVGDGAAGWPEAAPFDAVIATAAPTALPRPLWEQLAEGGRMVIPIGARPSDQMLWLIRKEEGQMQARALGAVRFVPLVSPLLDDPAECMTVTATAE